MQRLSSGSWFSIAAVLALVLGPCASVARAEALTLAWDRSPESDVVGYMVYVGTAPGVYAAPVNVGNVIQHVLNAAPGQQYCFRVSAYFAGPVEGERSPELCINSNGAPTLANPGSQSHALGAVASLPLSATDPESAPLTFSATGLPPGLTVTPATGIITGAPTQAGTFSVIAKVSDGTLSVSVPFTWTITSSVPVAPTPVGPSGATSSTTPNFDWQPVATATRYRLWVDDNSNTNPRVQVDLTPAQAGCAVAGSVCRHNPAIVLAAGPASWSVRASNATGDGPWSGAMDFAIADGRAPVTTINAPTSAATHATAATTVAIGGTATDDVGVVQVTWANDRGGAGSATGTSNWSVASVPLSPGANVITVTARDAENNTSTDTVTVTRTDGQAPTIEVTLPTTAASHSTTETTLALGGTAADAFGVTEVRWSSSRGPSGVANGTTSWGVPAVALQGGANVITVTARDAAGNAGTDVITVNVTDGAPPTIAVVGPTAAATFSTTAATVALSGTAADAFGVTQVTWANSRGGSGTAAGTTGWTVAAVALQPGDNVVTVTARDAVGLTATDVITVTRTDNDAPVVTISTPTSNATHSTGQATVALAGGATDAFGVTEVVWSSDRGASGAATGTTTWTIPAVALQGGANVITVTARDAGGRTGTDVITVTRTDGEPPTVSITSPTSAATYSTGTATLALGGTAADAFGVAQVTWSSSRGASGVATGTTAWSIAGISLQPGANVLTVTARDTGGNTTTDTLTVTLTDGTPPTVSITAPTDGPSHSTSNASVALGGTAADAFGVTEVRWASDRGASGVASGTTSWTVAAVTLSPGANVITVTARDAAGQSSTDSVTVTRTDTEAPTVVISTPTANTTHSVTTRTLALGGTASDTFAVTQVSWANDRGGSGSATGTTTWSIASVTLSPGANVITITARDAAGNVGRDAVTVTLTDGVDPEVRITAPAAASSAATTPTLTVQGSASDEFGVSGVTWANDRGGSGAATGTTAWSASVALKPGANVITVTATDAAGNTGTAKVSVVATDSTRPTVVVTTPAPKNRYLTTGSTLAIGGTAGDDFGLASVTWANDRGGSGAATGTTSWTIANLALQAGVNNITVTATDQAGNVATDVVRVTSDGRRPTVAITQPVATPTHAVRGATLDLGGSASDDLGVTEVSWSNNRGGNGVATGTTNWSAPRVALAAGVNVVTVTARDEVGNTATATLTVMLDTQAPGVTIESPTAAPTTATNAAAISLRGVANDDVGVTQVSWSNDRGGSGAAVGATGWSVANVALQLGLNVITVTASDAAGNTSTDALTVHYDTRAPVVSIAAPTAAASFATTSTGVALSGAATDDGSVAEVRWTNARGGAGIASGTMRWTVDRAALQLGANEITITARDAAGNTASARLVVTATDAQAPTVQITAPSNLDTFSTAARVINLSGTSSDDFGVTQIAWASDRGPSGVARGTGSWIAGGVALQPGVNVIAVTAVDGAGNSTTDVLRVTVDGQLPVVTITSPGSNFTSNTPAVTISGTASDDSGITQVTWTSDRGPSGAAVGTTNWTTPSIRLEAGTNVVTITVRDGSSNTASATVSIVYADSAPPAVRIASPTTVGTYTTGAATLALSGSASDAFGVTQVAWANDRGGSGVAVGTTGWSAASVPLAPGANTITVTARDAAGQMGTATLIVMRTGADPAPDQADRVISERLPNGSNPSANRVPLRTENAPAIASTPANVEADVPMPPAPQQTAPPQTTSRQTAPQQPAAPALPSATPPAPAAPTTPTAAEQAARATLANLAAAASPAATPRPATPNGAAPPAAQAPRSEAPAPTTTTPREPESPAADSTRDRPTPTVVVISAPAATDEFTTEDATITLAGTARHASGIALVTWATDRGASGTAIGRDQWTVPGFAVPFGTTVVVVTARNAAGEAATDTLILKRLQRAEIKLAITAPTVQPSWSTTSSAVALRGTASDNVVRVSWAADWGGSGLATGTTQWTIPTIGLRIGKNVVTVIATDRDGRTTQQVVTVTYGPRPNGTPSGLQ